MGSQTLSSVLDKQLRSLCLKDFPCGRGSWSKAKDSPSEERSWGYMEQDEGREGAEKEEEGALMDLLTCPHSPWQHRGSLSPQAAALRELAVRTPERLHDKFIFSYFATLRIVDKGVSVIDNGLLKFSNLEELVLTANNITEVPAGHFPSSLRILELCANQLSDLNGLSHHQLPGLQHLGLGSNRLGSHDNIHHLTGKYWPKLVSLDLSNCDFQAQQALVEALATLPCLRTLLLEGNPLTLTPSYPGFTVDSLPQLLYLDASHITAEERHRFRGLAKMRDVSTEQAVTTVSVCRIRGIPHPQMSVDDNASEFPVIIYRYFITYEFVGHPACNNEETNSDSVFDAAATVSIKNYNEETAVTSSSKPSGVIMNTEENSQETTHVFQSVSTVLTHSTSKLSWAECMDFTHTSTYIVGDLAHFKRFLNRGLHLSLQEEKVLSWPAPSLEAPIAKPKQTPKDKKGGREAPSKDGPKDNSKDKKKKPATDLVQDTPIRRTLGSVHVPLHSLLTGGHKVEILCDLGVLLTEPYIRATAPLEKDPAKKIKDNKEDKKLKSTRDGSAGQRNTAASKGKAKGCKESEVDVHTDAAASIQPEPVAVEFSVQLEKWQSASEAHRPLLSH